MPLTIEFVLAGTAIIGGLYLFRPTTQEEIQFFFMKRWKIHPGKRKERTIRNRRLGGFIAMILSIGAMMVWTLKG